MKNIVKLVVMIGVMSVTIGLTAYAGEWKHDAGGWWYQTDDGSYPQNGWMWIDGNNDGISECYYFNAQGYCLMGTTTPEGYEVDSNGAWIVNGQVQTQGTVNVATQTTNSLEIKSRFQSDEKTLWEDIYAAQYYADYSWGQNFDIGTFVKVLLSENSIGAKYTTDNYYYNIPRSELQSLLKNIMGESSYTSDGYSWEQWGFTETGAGCLGFYGGDFGAEYPFATIISVEDLGSGFLELKGIVGDRETGTNKIVRRKDFVAQIQYVSGGNYSSFVSKTFAY